MDRLSIMTPEELLEVELAIIGAAGVKVRYVGYQRDGKGGGVHIYDILSPRLAGFNYADGWPTRTLQGLRELGLVK